MKWRAEKRSQRRAGTAGEQPLPNKKTNQRVNTEDVQTDSPDLCSVFDISHCLYVRAAGGGEGMLREEERPRVSLEGWFEKQVEGE